MKSFLRSRKKKIVFFKYLKLKLFFSLLFKNIEIRAKKKEDCYYACPAVILAEEEEEKRP